MPICCTDMSTSFHFFFFRILQLIKCHMSLRGSRKLPPAVATADTTHTQTKSMWCGGHMNGRRYRAHQLQPFGTDKPVPRNELGNKATDNPHKMANAPWSTQQCTDIGALALQMACSARLREDVCTYKVYTALLLRVVACAQHQWTGLKLASFCSQRICILNATHLLARSENENINPKQGIKQQSCIYTHAYKTQSRHIKTWNLQLLCLSFGCLSKFLRVRLSRCVSWLAASLCRCMRAACAALPLSATILS